MKDVYGVGHKWLLVVKDHFMVLVYLCSFPSKLAMHTAYELNHICGLIGYPIIYQSN
jgi:hypothetical protein